MKDKDRVIITLVFIIIFGICIFLLKKYVSNLGGNIIIPGITNQKTEATSSGEVKKTIPSILPVIRISPAPSPSQSSQSTGQSQSMIVSQSESTQQPQASQAPEIKGVQPLIDIPIVNDIFKRL